MRILDTNQFVSERIKFKPVTNAEWEQVQNNIIPKYNYFPKTKLELRRLIQDIISRKGTNCNLNDIDVSEITDMSYLFADKDERCIPFGDIVCEFHGDISMWDVSNVANMNSMFWGARSFDCNISAWDVSNVRDMLGMFCQAYKFNQNISSWKVSSVVDMSYMFQDALHSVSLKFCHALPSFHSKICLEFPSVFKFKHPVIEPCIVCPVRKSVDAWVIFFRIVKHYKLTLHDI